MTTVPSLIAASSSAFMASAVGEAAAVAAVVGAPVGAAVGAGVAAPEQAVRTRLTESQAAQRWARDLTFIASLLGSLRSLLANWVGPPLSPPPSVHDRRQSRMATRSPKNRAIIATP